MALEVLKHTYGHSDPLWGYPEEGEGSPIHTVRKPCFTIYTHRFWTLLLLLAKHKPEESEPAVQACHLICKCLKGIHLGAQACI